MLATSAPSARAQSAPELAAAQGWFSEGLALESKGQWPDALDRFRKVAAVKHTPQVDFHLGLCEARSGQLVPALVNFGRALEGARAQGVASVESAAQRELEALRARVPRVRVVVPAGVSATDAAIDGRAIALVTLADAIPLEPGAHAIRVSFASGDVVKHITLEEGARLTLDVAPPPAPTAARPTPIFPTPPVPAPPRASRVGAAASTRGSSSTLGWVIAGTGGAALAGAVVFLVLRGNEISTLDAACGDGRAFCPDSARSHYDAGKTDTLAAAVLGGVGLVGIGVGAALLVSSGRSETHADAIVTPTVFPNGGGAALSGRFASF